MATRAGHPLLLLLLCVAVSGPAWAQHGIVPPKDRALHERLAAARIVAIATVVRVDEGRIAFEAGRPIVGAIEPEFELKRAPSRPSPWAPGDRALLLLSGARPPYRWVDRPEEALTLADAHVEQRFAAAIREMDAARVDGRARRDLYARWSDGPHEDLAAMGLRGLMDVRGMAAVLAPDFALSRAEVAADPARSVESRRRAARVAARHPAGIKALLEHLERDGNGTDPGVAEVAFQAGLVAGTPTVEARLIDALATPETEFGKLGLKFAMFAKGPEVERRLSELAVGHPDGAVREEAVEALQGLRRKRTK